ncbi:NAD/NADP transhydrogenase beta subunit [Gaiella occulta]|uniref:NAD(P) transhydrogenase subunit beta n=1 Tax=Gaiella occulta TaxID=1002870 RepID=A0A7M2YWG6_9ACTN|nr:NAD(P)(+) transhydrogenase (Re/Si-specific) subunit beta [Gaiella occulta]RDI73778.1 NAD/NADP transhydrogenase beta subunit [Gaiella occulta]
MGRTTSDALYLVTIVTFILALRFLSSPKHARKGNWIGAAGMTLAIVVTLAHRGLGNYLLIGIAMAIGAAVGAVGARTVKMTAMPQMVALFNGVGGGAAALIALVEFHDFAGGLSTVIATSTVLSALIGSVSFSGSLVAFAKLQELVSGRPIVFRGQQVVNGLIILAAVVLGITIAAGGAEQWMIYGLVAAAFVFGIMFVLPIGGADMPVVISLLNAFTGLAASATGFVLHNNVLIVSGALVGASGTLLTLLMGKAMNRSVTNVLFGAFGQVQAGAASVRVDDGRTVRATSPDDVAVMLSYARKVIVVPGYGLAVAQAQHDVRQLAELLEEKGVEVAYAIHPVAGRMPGHMNVLLAEANVPYDQLKEMDEINPEFPQTDVALVIGANDVTNPAARADTSSPIYGMPILDVDRAASVVVMKRSMNPGFAGIDNELYLDAKTTMLFGDAKESVVKLIAAVKSL